MLKVILLVVLALYSDGRVEQMAVYDVTPHTDLSRTEVEGIQTPITEERVEKALQLCGEMALRFTLTIAPPRDAIGVTSYCYLGYL